MNRLMIKKTSLVLAVSLFSTLSACGASSSGLATLPEADTTAVVVESEQTILQTEQTPPSTTEQSEAETTDSMPLVYDTSTEYQATILKNGDELIGGTYTATGKDESVLEASGNVSAAVTGSVLKKASGDASSADDSSFKGVNAAVRVYGNADGSPRLVPKAVKGMLCEKGVKDAVNHEQFRCIVKY